MKREEMLAAIKAADKAYYDKDNPVMTDAEYDALRNSYIKEFGNEDLNYVPGNVTSEFKPFVHMAPVASLAKVKAGEDAKLTAQVEKLWPAVLEPKIDGLTVVAYPNADGSCTFVSRGNGNQGETLPNFISRYENKPFKIGEKNQKIFLDNAHPVRGEVFLSQSAFEKINKMLGEEGKPLFANPRNAAAGILRNKERSRFIDMLAYQTYDVIGVDWTENEKLVYIKENTSFTAVDVYKYNSIEDTVEAVPKLYDRLIADNEIPIDGIVIKTNLENSLELFGRTDHHPNNAMAWKPAMTTATTILKDIEWQVGRRYITPVAIMEPVELLGSTVEKASVANISIIKKLGLTKGAKVSLTKANEIIPQIISVLEDGDQPIEVPTVCPCCGEKLEFDNDRLFCPNDLCDEKIAQDMAYIASKKVLDIKGLSISTCRKLIALMKEHGQTPHRFGFMDVDSEKLKELPGFGQKSVQKLMDECQSKTKNVSFPKFIASLAIPGIGTTAGTLLEGHWHSFEAFKQEIYGANIEAAKEMLLSIDGIGPEIADAILSDEFKKRLECKYITIAQPSELDGNTANVPEGGAKIFVLTGKMPEKRSFYEEKIKAAGHKVADAVSGTTDYLVIADVNSTSSKVKKARKLGTQLIAPEDIEKFF